MKRRLFLMAIAGAAGCTPRRRPRLNVYNWSAYVAPDTIPNFEREFGVSVRYSIYESNEEMLAKVMTGNSGWDVVFPSNYIIKPLTEYRLLAPLDHGRLKNLDNLSPEYRRPSWDRALQWSAPYTWGAAGILYHRSAPLLPKAWSDLWDPRLRGRITMLDDPAEVIGACLKKLGHSINSTDPAQLAAARREAIAQKLLVRAYLNAEVRDQVVAGDVLAAQAWATFASQARQAATDANFAFPEEGFSLYCDSAVILRESRRAELAHLFIDYLLRPQVAAAVVEATRTATCNGAAYRLLDPALQNDPLLHPPSETLRRGEWFEPLPAPAQRLRDRIWTEIKSA